MIKIGKSYISIRKEFASVEAKISISEAAVSRYLKNTSKMTKPVWRTHLGYPSSINYNLYFATQKKWEKYLCTERSDAFVMALLWYAIVSESDIYFEDPMSQRLYDGLTNTLIKKLCGQNYKIIKLVGPTTNKKLSSNGAIGSGMTCGVDSFYTLISYKKELTHLCFFDYGIVSVPEWMNAETNKSYYEEVHKHLFNKSKNIEIVCKKNNLEYVFVTTNLEDDFYMGAKMYRVMHLNLACALALEHLFKKYISSSSGHEKDLEVSPTAPSQHYENLLTATCKTETMDFVSSDNMSRFEKLKIIKDYEPAYDTLEVCMNEGKNCGECFGCLKTIIVLDELGALDKFHKVFDLSSYYKNRNKLIKFYTTGLKIPGTEWLRGSWDNMVKYAKTHNNKACQIVLEVNNNL